MRKQSETMGEQLKQIKGIKMIRTKMFPLPSLNSIGEDGVDHTNIWENGATDLGKALSSFTALPFKHSVYGKFTSMEGFWHYIRSVTKDDNLRHLSGYNARALGRTLENKGVPDMSYIIADANWQKIQTYPALIEQIKELNNPFDSYYIENNAGIMVRARPLHSTWLIPAFHEIHEAIHQDREPDFEFLKDDNRPKLYHPLIERERAKGGYNARLSEIYKQRPKQQPVLTTPKFDGYTNKAKDPVSSMSSVDAEHQQEENRENQDI